MTKGHTCEVESDRTRVPSLSRAVCACGWASPWVSGASAHLDVSPTRPASLLAVRAARWHITAAARAR